MDDQLLPSETNPNLVLASKAIAGGLIIFMLVAFILGLAYGGGENRGGFYPLGLALIVILIASVVHLNWFRTGEFESLDNYNAYKATLAIQSLGLFILAIGVLVVYDAKVRPPNHWIGGVASGVVGSGMVIELNGGNDISLPDAPPDRCTVFNFNTPIQQGKPYNVRLKSSPNAAVCSGGGNGVVGGDVMSAGFSCIAAYQVGGEITAGSIPAGGSIVLTNNGADALQRTGDGGFEFPQLVANNSNFRIAVLTPPQGRTCQVAGDTGTIRGAPNRNARVVCT